MFLETPLHTYKFDAIKCNLPDIPIINMDNALLYKLKNDSSRIDCGLTLHNGQYYYFDIDIVSTKHYRYRSGDQYSYKIRPVTNDIANRMMNGEFVQHWEIVLSAFFYYGNTWLTYNIGAGNVYSFEFLSTMDRGLVIPIGLSPGSGYKKGMTIGDFLDDNRKVYPEKFDFIINRTVYRDFIIDNILDF